MGPPLGLGLLGARIWSNRPVAAVLLAAVAGSLLAVFAVLTKGVVDVVEPALASCGRHPSCMPGCSPGWPE
jgi:hypothetical protein